MKAKPKTTRVDDYLTPILEIVKALPYSPAQLERLAWPHWPECRAWSGGACSCRSGKR